MTKPYKCRVEYLTSDGNQYIDIGVGVKANTVFKAIFSVASTSTGRSYFGARNSSNERFQIVNSIGIGGGYYLVNSVYPIADKKYEIEMHASGEMYLDGVKRNASTGTFSQVSFERNLWLFATNYYDSSVGGGASTFWKAQIFEGDTLVRDFIPVLDNNGKPAMYDNVSGQLFYNQGTGEFTYGRQIIPVEYLESTGTQYIDTGIKGKNNIDFDYKCIFTNLDGTGQCVGGNWSGASTSSVSLYFGLIRANGNFAYHYDGTSSPVVVMNTTVQGTPYSVQGHMWTGEQYMVINGTKSSVGTISSTFTSSLNMYLFGINNNGLSNPAYLKLYYCKIWDNDILTRDFIPCIDENNVPFMFDLVTNTIYDNAGTGQFKFGANVEKNGSKKMLRKKLALMLATLKKKRPYYCEVEYLESTGTQYIDTGIAPSNITPIVKLKFITTQLYTAGNYGIFGCFGANNTRFQIFYNSIGIGTYVSKTWPIDTTYEVELNGKVPSATINGTVETSGYSTANGFSSYNMYLFTRNNGDTADNGVPLKLYYCKIWDNDVLVRDMIPVLDWNMTPCMYDKVSGRLFYNQGTGTFSYGREIHYVDYLETDGKAYINTGYIPSGSTETEITTRAKNQSTSRFMFGCRTANGQDIYACLLHSSNRIGYRVGTGGYLYSSGYDELNTKHTYKIANGVFYRDGEVVNATCEGAEASPNSPLALLTVNTNNVLDTAQSFIGNFYSCTMKENNMLVRDYIPAIDENGVGFMFDRVTHTIFDNKGTGSFKYPPVELEYLESDSTAYIDTGISGANNNLKIEMDFSYSKFYAYAYFFSNYESEQHDTTRFLLDSSNNSRGLAYINTKSQNGAIYTPYNLTVNDKHNIILTKTTVSIDGVIATNTNPPTGTANTKSIVLFNRGAGSYADKRDMGMKCYYFRIYDNDALILNFIPAYKDGQAGMWNKVNDVFYPNAGTGSFSVGKIKEKDWEEV